MGELAIDPWFDLQQVDSLTARLSRRDPLRSYVRQCLNTMAVSQDCLLACFQAMEEPRGYGWRRAALAVYVLAHAPLDGDAHARAINILRRVVENGLPLTRKGRAIHRCEVAARTVGLLAIAVVSGSSGAGSNTFYIDSAANIPRAYAILALGSLRAVECAATVARARNEISAGVVDAAASALPVILQSITPAYYGQTSADYTPALCALLNDRYAEMQEDILRGLEMAGDGRAVAVIERFMNKTRAPLAAERALRVLRERQRLECASARLLRPSDETTSDDTLLRPIAATAEANPEMLLRPRDGE